MNTLKVQMLMKKRGLKKKEVAKTLGITPNSLANKLKGKSEFKMSEMAKLAGMLGEKNLVNLFFQD